MYAAKPHLQRRRRGVILVLVLGMLGLLALIGVTFASFSGQAKVGAFNFAESQKFPDSAEVMDFALEQLINDTNNPLSAMRGHSLKRDMFGNDSTNSFALTALPAPSGAALTASYVQTNPNGTVVMDTNIPVGPIATQGGTVFTELYGLTFLDWFLRLELWQFVNGVPVQQVVNTAQLGASPGVVVVPQTIQVVADANDGNGNHLLTLAVPSPIPNLVQPTMSTPPGTGFLIKLDNRYRRAFNGAGMAAADHLLDPVNYPFVTQTATPLGYPIQAARYGNFRFNGAMITAGANPTLPILGNPSYAAMDEDYDAADLENWFLAIQSADGQVVIPSFHRPGILAYDPVSGVNDWTLKWNPNNNDLANFRAVEAMSKILRPRGIDHPEAYRAGSLPDLLPDANGSAFPTDANYNPNFGKIQYDVDNDGDGVTDSVWLDLGYPAQRDSSGKMFKPLFAYMVQGVNGRMPLNTAGNLNARDNAAPTTITAGTNITLGQPLWDHKSHLGVSPSEINPKYAFQNQLASQQGLDILQLRRLLSGGFPYDPTSGVTLNAYPNQPIAGRWGEAEILSLPKFRQGLPASGYAKPYYFAGNTPPNSIYNPIGPGASIPPTLAKYDGVDDDYNGLDFYPGYNLDTTSNKYTLHPEMGEFLDATYSYQLPSERMRRFVTPFDLSGNGLVVPFNNLPSVDAALIGVNPLLVVTNPGNGFDRYGRSSYYMHYRPPGAPTEIHYTIDKTTTPWTYTYNGLQAAQVTDGGSPAKFTGELTNNPIHGYESFRNPLDQDQGKPDKIAPASLMAMAPYDLSTKVDGTNQTQRNLPPQNTPTFDAKVNSSDPPADPTTGVMPPIQGMYPGGSLAWNDPDEMNLYTANEVDAPFGPQDLEWLYRAHDVDGTSLDSRLKHLDVGYWNPSNPYGVADTMTRRRLFTTETWERNSFSWAPMPYMNTNVNRIDGLGAVWFQPPKGTTLNTSPIQNQFPAIDPANPYAIIVDDPASPGTPKTIQNPAYQSNGGPFYLTEPALANADRRINLNYPLPVDPRHDEPVRIKWVAEVYRLFKAILPPSAVDEPGELAQLSQFAVNIVDYRDPDGTMTRIVNTDVKVIAADTTNKKPMRLIYAWDTGDPDYGNALPLIQYGMEYPALAINEVLAYSYQSYDTAQKKYNASTPRLHIELVNMLTKDNGDGTNPGTASDLSLKTGGWKLTVAPDDVTGRPNPYTGQPPQDNFNIPPGPPGTPGKNYYTGTAPVATRTDDAPDIKAGGMTDTPKYLYLANALAAGIAYAEPKAPAADAALPDSLLDNTKPTNAYYWLYLSRPANPLDPSSPQVVVDSFRFPYIQDNGTIKQTDGTFASQGNVDIYSLERLQPWRGGQDVPLIPTPALPTTGYEDSKHDPVYGFSEQTVPPKAPDANWSLLSSDAQQLSYGKIYHTLNKDNSPDDNQWDYLPFLDRDFMSPAELLLVPGCPPGLFTKQFVEHNPPAWRDTNTQHTTDADKAYHRPATPLPTALTANPPKANDVDNSPTAPRSTVGYPFSTPPAVRPLNKDYDSTKSGSLPPSGENPIPNFFQYVPQPLDDGTKAQAGMSGDGLPPVPRVYPYLPDAFYYHNNAATGDQTGTSWYKMLEFFEVPAPTRGAIGPVAAGSNLDWYRQDLRPGQINLNLIVDEEVFFGLVDDYRLNLNPAVLTGGTTVPPTGAQIDQYMPRVVTLTDYTGKPTVSQWLSDMVTYPQGRGFYSALLTNHYSEAAFGVGAMKAAFADFLKMRHGGTNYLFAYGQGGLGAPNAAVQYPANGTTAGALYPADTRVAAERPFRSLSFSGVDYTVLRPAKLPYPAPDGSAQSYTTKRLSYWPSIPPRPLFALPDQTAKIDSWTGPVANPAALGLPDQRLDNSGANGGPASNYEVTNTYGSLVDNTLVNKVGQGQADWDTVGGSGVDDGSGSGTTVVLAHLHLGGNGQNDNRQHPYWRTEWLQKVMNLSTVRTHQYAVWVTVGFFEVVQTGNPQLALASPPYNLQAADQLGAELGAATGRSVRYRSFFLLDRTQATGFNPALPGDYRECVAYSRRIE